MIYGLLRTIIKKREKKEEREKERSNKIKTLVRTLAMMMFVLEWSDFSYWKIWFFWKGHCENYLIFCAIKYIIPTLNLSLCLSNWSKSYQLIICCTYISFDLRSFHWTVNWRYNSCSPLPGPYPFCLFLNILYRYWTFISFFYVLTCITLLSSIYYLQCIHCLLHQTHIWRFGRIKSFINYLPRCTYHSLKCQQFYF